MPFSQYKNNRNPAVLIDRTYRGMRPPPTFPLRPVMNLPDRTVLQFL